jgi:hypothetical protein
MGVGKRYNNMRWELAVGEWEKELKEISNNEYRVFNKDTKKYLPACPLF